MYTQSIHPRKEFQKLTTYKQFTTKFYILTLHGGFFRNTFPTTYKDVLDFGDGKRRS